MSLIRFGENVVNEDGVLVVEWDLPGHRLIERDDEGQISAERPFSSEEEALLPALIASRDAQVSEVDLLRKARGALSANRQWLGRATAPTNAQAVDQIDRLTRQMNALILLRVEDYTDTTGT